MTERLHFHFLLSCIEEGNGNPLQCSCLENPRDREAWWAAVYGVAQSRTRLKQLSSSSSSKSEVSQKEKSKYCILTQIYEMKKDGNNNPVYKTAKETLMYRTVFWTLWEKEKLG